MKTEVEKVPECENIIGIPSAEEREVDNEQDLNIQVLEIMLSDLNASIGTLNVMKENTFRTIAVLKEEINENIETIYRINDQVEQMKKKWIREERIFRIVRIVSVVTIFLLVICINVFLFKKLHVK